MPLYDFECETCGEKIEEFIKLDEEYPSCPKESSHGKMNKLLSKAAIRMGGGLYSFDPYKPDKFGDLE